MNRKQTIIIALCILAALIFYFIFCHWFQPTRILVVNPLPAQAAEITLNNDSRGIKVRCVGMEDAHDFSDYDAVLMYGRGLFLDSLQMQEIDKAAKKGVKIYTNALRNFSFVVNHNIDSLQMETLHSYFRNPCKANYVNLLKYVRAISTPHRIGSMDYEPPVELPSNMFYHLEGGNYFESASELTEYLKRNKLYHKDGKNIALISGLTFPVEGNRAHIDTLISRITQAGYNVYPLSAKGERRAKLIRQVNPDAIVYLPMGRLGNDSLINWCYDREIPLFMPFPLIQTREDWLDVNKPVSAGTLNARIVVPEIDGAMTPICISTQDPNDDGYLMYNPDPERMDAFMEQFTRFMNLKTKSNKDKKVAIGYFKSPGKDALLASGMEVVPSLYNFLKRLKSEGYEVSGLPTSLDAFKKDIMTRGAVMGDYAPAAQKKFMEECYPKWIKKDIYEKWASEVLLPEKYQEVKDRYGDAPGHLLSRGDSIAFAAIQYGNILLFPQPRPALGDDDFKLVHGAEVAPPHSYLAPYLYVQKAFDADAIIHFGTHGNLEFTPGKNAALSQADWAEVLIGNRPHFYFYTTGNVGEAIIAKRRSHAVLVTHLTPPYMETGMRTRYSSLLDDIHSALAYPERNNLNLKKEIMDLGLHSDLKLDSTLNKPFSSEDLEIVDSFLEELANEKITGAYYVMGQPYSDKEMESTLVAIAADKIAYSRAKEDFQKGKISEKNLQDATFIRHHYYDKAEATVRSAAKGSATDNYDFEQIKEYKGLLESSAGSEIESMVGALSGRPVRPAPGGDPVLNPNVLPMGRNMFSINAEATPGEKAWNDGVTLADQTIENYKKEHGEYPKKVTYTFWAGEFISTQGATLAQAFRMLGVEPVRDDQGRVMDLKLTSSKELGRPRINVMIQVSGQLRDIAGSRLQMLTDAVKLASEAKDDIFPNYVAEGTLEQEKNLVDNGVSPKDARMLSTARVFGPVNNGYGSGMLSYTENSGEWDDRSELADGFINNMCAIYGDTVNWGKANPQAFKAAIVDTDVVVQPRHSNTWGPVSLDHVYEYTGGLSLVATTVNGKEPDAVMADYRNSYLPRMQDAQQAVALEMRASLLNPNFVKERMKGDAGTAQMFGEMFRNVFGWSVMRPSALNENTYGELYKMYVEDENNLGIKEYFERVNPAALQEMTATMMESARKGYWKPSKEQLEKTAELHAEITEKNGAPCTEFVCSNGKLQKFIASKLDASGSEKYLDNISQAVGGDAAGTVMKRENMSGIIDSQHNINVSRIVIIIVTIAIILMTIIFIRKRKNKE
ncbi:MAG: cobaltochelatase subunit CobN [Muribaculum sp.]|nr:cobaltochelatase subunit CobN [Muribaculum sp.]